MQEQQEDIAIIQMVLQGRQSAYAALVERYQSYVFTIVMRHVHNRELAEELAQDVFVKAYKSLADFKGNSKFSTWLYTIAHHTCLSHLRKRPDSTVLPGDEKMQLVVENHGQSGHHAHVLEQRTQKQLLDQAINRLPGSDAEIVTLFYKAEQSLEEIGAITGLTPGNVKVRLFRARSKLKEILQHVSSEFSMR